MISLSHPLQSKPDFLRPVNIGNPTAAFGESMVAPPESSLWKQSISELNQEVQPAVVSLGSLVPFPLALSKCVATD